MLFRSPTLDAVISTDKPSYVNKERATILLSVTDGTTAVSGVSVSATVTSSKGTKTTLAGTTGANGVAVMSYLINSRQGTGTYRVDTSSVKSGYRSAADTCTFTVTR